MPWHGINRERSTNYAAGILTDDEKAELEHGWMLEFEKAQGLDEAAERQNGQKQTKRVSR